MDCVNMYHVLADTPPFSVNHGPCVAALYLMQAQSKCYYSYFDLLLLNMLISRIRIIH